MLSKADNELLTRVGQGTPMGELLRQYWVPVLFSLELAEPACPPLRVRLLGDDLIGIDERLTDKLEVEVAGRSWRRTLQDAARRQRYA